MESLRVIGNATKCNKCREMQFGLRLGCRCDKDLNNIDVAHGFLIKADNGENAFMSFEQCQNKVLVDHFTDETIETED